MINVAPGRDFLLVSLPSPNRRSTAFFRLPPDLGTIYSCVGVWQHDRVEIIAWRLFRPRLAPHAACRGPLAGALPGDQKPRFAIDSPFFAASRGFSAETLTPRNQDVGLAELPATVAAVKNPSAKIVYDEYNHERYPPGDPSKRAFAYFVLSGGRFIYASLLRLLILKFVLSMSASKDVLALASLE